jgi:hypothetical protein
MNNSNKKDGRRSFIRNATISGFGLLVGTQLPFAASSVYVPYNSLPGKDRSANRIFCSGNSLFFPRSVYDAPAIDLLNYPLSAIRGYTLVNIDCCLAKPLSGVNGNIHSFSAHLIFYYRDGKKNIELNWFNGLFQPNLQAASSSLIIDKSNQGIMYFQDRSLKEWLPLEKIQPDSGIHSKNYPIETASKLFEAVYAGNLAIEGFHHLKQSKCCKFLPEHYLRLAWDGTKSEVTNNEDIHQFKSGVSREMAKRI